MVKAVRGNGATSGTWSPPTRRHGYKKKVNLDYQFWATVLFWQKNLLN